MPELVPNQTPGHGLRNAAFLIVLLWGVGEGRAFLIPLCVAGLLAFLMAPIHRFLQRRLKAPDGVAVALSAIALISPLLLIGYLLVRQGEGLVQDFPHLLRVAQEQFARFSEGPWGRRLGLAGMGAQELLNRVSSSAGQGIIIVVASLGALINAGSQGVLILLFSVLMLASRVHLRRSGERIIAQSPAFHGPRLLDEVVSLVQHFLTARMLIVGIIGAAASVVLALFGVSYSVFLGGLIGLFTLVPAVGFLISLVPTLAVAFASGHSFGSVLAMTGCLVALSIIEGNVLTPKMVGNRLNINALTSFVGLFAGGLLWGVWGMFLAIPILGVIRIAFSAVPTLHPWGELLADRTEGEGPRKPAERPRKRAA
jgi:predicted PurR-regulated permease PerM